MEEHFRALYANPPFEYFLYDSSKLGQVRNFATSPHIQIMVVAVGAINKEDVNNLYKDSEKTGGEKFLRPGEAYGDVEIEADTGIRFGIVEEHQFAGVAIMDSEGKVAPLGFERSKVLWGHLKSQGYIDAKGKIQESLKKALKDGTLTVPETFAAQLENNEAVKVHAKLPGWFKVPTPLGTYNPDWAVLVEADGAERLYFVVETKYGLFGDDIRERESAKITCGEAHFKALERGDNPAIFKKASTLEDLLAPS